MSSSVSSKSGKWAGASQHSPSRVISVSSRKTRGAHSHQSLPPPGERKETEYVIIGEKVTEGSLENATNPTGDPASSDPPHEKGNPKEMPPPTQKDKSPPRQTAQVSISSGTKASKQASEKGGDSVKFPPVT